MKPDDKIHYVYLGKRGGGGHDLLNFVASTPAQYKNIFAWIADDLDVEIMRHLGGNTRTQLNTFILPRSGFCALLAGFAMNLRQLWRFSRIKKGEIVVFVMPSPYDLVLHAIAKVRGYKTVCLVHELVHHPGDKWPLRSSIARRAKWATYVMCYSNTISAKVREEFGRSALNVSVPLILDTNSKIGEDLIELSQNAAQGKLRIGMLGRQRKYKGVDYFLQAVNMSDKNFEFYIFSEVPFSQIGFDNLHGLYRWFNQSELISIISFLDVIVMPYLNGSQSGFIPTLISMNKWIVATRIPGLVEQLGDYEKCCYFDVEDSKSLTQALYYVQKSNSSNKFANTSSIPKNSFSTDYELVLEKIATQF